jgi:hypothetical protein
MRLVMAQVNSEVSIITPPNICELGLRLRLRRAGMRLERSGFGYKLLHHDTVLLARGPNGYGLTLQDVDLFTRHALRGRTDERP